MHLRSFVLAVAAAGMLAFAAPTAIAAVDLASPEVGIAQGFGCDTPQLEPDAYLVEMLFSESVDLALCEPKLLAATGLCLEAVRFDGQEGPGLVLDIRRLDCSQLERSPPS